MIASLTVTDINFEPDGTAIITFIDTADVRCGGAVAVRRSVRIVPTEQYAPDLDKLIGRAKALLNDALEDWATSEPVPLEQLGPAHPERPFESERLPRADRPDGLADDEGDEDDAIARRNWDAITEARHGPQAEVPADRPEPAAAPAT